MYRKDLDLVKHQRKQIHAIRIRKGLKDLVIDMKKRRERLM